MQLVHWFEMRLRRMVPFYPIHCLSMLVSLYSPKKVHIMPKMKNKEQTAATAMSYSWSIWSQDLEKAKSVSGISVPVDTEAVVFVVGVVTSTYTTVGDDWSNCLPNRTSRLLSPMMLCISVILLSAWKRAVYCLRHSCLVLHLKVYREYFFH